MKHILYDIFDERWMTILVNNEDEDKARHYLDEAYDEWMNPEKAADPITDRNTFLYIHDSCCEEYLWDRFQRSGIAAVYFPTEYDVYCDWNDLNWYNPYGWKELIYEV